MPHASNHRHRSRYTFKLVHGSLILQGRHVDAMVDDDSREIRVSDQVPPADRLELAARLKRMVTLRPGDRRGAGVCFHTLRACREISRGRP